MLSFSPHTSELPVISPDHLSVAIAVFGHIGVKDGYAQNSAYVVHSFTVEHLEREGRNRPMPMKSGPMARESMNGTRIA